MGTLRFSRVPLVLARLVRMRNGELLAVQFPVPPLEGGQPVEHGEPGLLHHLLGHGAAGHVDAGQAEQRSVVTGHEPCEGGLVPGEELLDQLRVAVTVRSSHLYLDQPDAPKAYALQGTPARPLYDVTPWYIILF